MQGCFENPFANDTIIAGMLRSCVFFCSQKKVEEKLQRQKRELNKL